MDVMAGTSRTTAGRALALGGAGTVCGAAAWALAARVAELAGSTGAARVDQLVELAVLGVGVLVLAWLGGSAGLASACLTARLAGRTWRRGEGWVRRFAPAAVRRALVVAVATGIGVGPATGAFAAEPPAPGPAVAVTAPASPTTSPTAAADATLTDLGWVATRAAEPAPSAATTWESSPATWHSTPTVTPDPAPDTATAVPAAPPAAPADASADGATVTVVCGDSLWAIAARHLDAGATDAEIAATWPAWYQRNAATIGADPDLILPGQVLVVPAEVAR